MGQLNQRVEEIKPPRRPCPQSVPDDDQKHTFISPQSIDLECVMGLSSLPLTSTTH